MTPLLIGESRAEEAGPSQRLLRGRRHFTPVGDCRDPRDRAKASQSPSQGAWWVHRLPNHISKTVLSIVGKWWATLESNQGPQSYQDCALTD